MQAIWCHYFIQGNKEIAQNIWTAHIQYAEDIFYRTITWKAICDNNEAIILQLIDCLKSAKAGKANLAGAYNSLLEIYVRKERLDDALKIVQIMRNRSDTFFRSTLAQLRTRLEVKGRKFPYRMPRSGHKVVLKVKE